MSGLHKHIDPLACSNLSVYCSSPCVPCFPLPQSRPAAFILLLRLRSGRCYSSFSFPYLTHSTGMPVDSDPEACIKCDPPTLSHLRHLSSALLASWVSCLSSPLVIWKDPSQFAWECVVSRCSSPFMASEHAWNKMETFHSPVYFVPPDLANPFLFSLCAISSSRGVLPGTPKVLRFFPCS